MALISQQSSSSFVARLLKGMGCPAFLTEDSVGVVVTTLSSLTERKLGKVFSWAAAAGGW